MAQKFHFSGVLGGAVTCKVNAWSSEEDDGESEWGVGQETGTLVLVAAVSIWTRGGIARASLMASWLAKCLEARFHTVRAACRATHSYSKECKCMSVWTNKDMYILPQAANKS